MRQRRPSRRRLLQIGAAAVGGSLLAAHKASALETDPRKLGDPLGPYSERSPFEKAVRWRRESKTPETGSSFTPLHDSVGSVTPSALHYERHHSGIPAIDPARHRLVIHGLVDRPLSLSMADIHRLPSVTRILVLECGGNSGGEWGSPTGADVQRSYGLVSGSEWTGVPLSLLLGEAGVQARASWVIAEGADGCRMMRSIPLAKALEN
jgi:sulfane dehydrogenase subunit SoxC